MTRAPHPRPTPADSVPIRLSRSPVAPEPPEAPRPEAAPKRTLPVGLEALLSLDDLAALLSCSRRLVERMRSAGKVPKPDIKIGKMPRWKAATIRAWIERGGRL